jgi:hypothetical protein
MHVYKALQVLRDANDSEEKKTKKMATGVLITLVILALIYLALFIAVLVTVVKHINEMPSWAVIIAMMGLFLPIPGGLIVSYILTKTRKDY